MSRPIIDYLVNAATRLWTKRKIGGVEFDGTEDIDLPGVNKKGNQDTSGKAARATRLVLDCDFSITGDVAAPKVTFNGTEHVELAATLKSVGEEGTYGSKNKIPRLTTDTKGRVTGVEEVDLGGTTHLLVDETVVINANEDRDYNISTIAGANLPNYNLAGLTVTVLVEDTNAQSPTHGFFINSEAAIVVGVSANRLSVKLSNGRAMNLRCNVRISVGAA